MKSKICSKCLIEKDESEYGWKSKIKGRRDSQCKECKNKHERSRYNENPFQKRNDNKEYMKNYRANRTLEEYEKDKEEDRKRHLNLRPEQIEIKRIYQKSERGKQAFRKYAQSKAGRENSQKGSRKYKEKYPEKIRAHSAVYTALKQGLLVKPTNCSVCQRPAKLEGHHYKGYDRAHWLDIVWVCKPCHMIEDKKCQQQ